MATADAACQRLCDPEAEVSAHYLIERNGSLRSLVHEEDRAWHAGAGEWDGQEDINSRSIGIELDNDGRSPFPEPQMAALEDLLHGLTRRWSIPPHAVIGHSDLAPGRKIDPGPRFDWQRLERQGLAQQRGTIKLHGTADMTRFRSLAQNAGYTAPVDDKTLLATVRLRFRPWARGPLTPNDLTPLAGPGAEA